MYDIHSGCVRFSSGDRAMPGKRSSSVFIALCITGMLLPMRLLAADLSIAPGPAASLLKEKSSMRQARTDKPKRPEKRRKSRIRTYSLFNKEPVFNLPGAQPRKERGLVGFEAEPRYPLPQRAGSFLPAPALKVAEPESAGIAFGCTRAVAANAFRRSMTACYRFQDDGGWKTQTYVSKEFSESGSDWGGGLSVTYAH